MGARVRLMRLLQAAGAVKLDVTVSLVGDYSEDDDRLRYRILASGTGRIRTYQGRTLEEAVETLLVDIGRHVPRCCR